jgi:F-type H+-transporting ATPase subunit epsilon
MATFHFDLVSPEKLAFSGEVEQVDVPGVEGDFGVLAGHAPVVAAIRPGILTVTSEGRHQKIIVLGGLAEMSDNGLTVLADVATSLEDLDRAKFADKISDMEAKLSEKEGSALDRPIERRDHIKSIQHKRTTTALQYWVFERSEGRVASRTRVRSGIENPIRFHRNEAFDCWHHGFAGSEPTAPNAANCCATIRYTSRLNGTTSSATRSRRSHRQRSNSAGCPLRDVRRSISSSDPVKRSANHF